MTPWNAAGLLGRGGSALQRPARTPADLAVRIVWRLLAIALSSALVIGFWLGWPTWVECALAGLLLAGIAAQALGYVQP